MRAKSRSESSAHFHACTQWLLNSKLIETGAKLIGGAEKGQRREIGVEFS